jgi:hypothetical protein
MERTSGGDGAPILGLGDAQTASTVMRPSVYDMSFTAVGRDAVRRNRTHTKNTFWGSDY